MKDISADVNVPDGMVSPLVYLADTSGGNVEVTLPQASTVNGQEVAVVHKTAGNTLTVTPNGSETVKGSASWSSTSADDRLSVYSDGSNWLENDSGGISATAGTDKEGNSASLLVFAQTDDTEHIERSMLTTGNSVRTTDYHEVSDGQNAVYNITLSNDVNQGNGHRTIFAEYSAADDGLSDSLASFSGDSTSDGGVGEGNFLVEGRFNDTSAQVELNANESNTSSNKSRCMVYGQDTSSLGLTDARFVWKKGSTDVLALAGDGALAVKGDIGFYDTTPISKPTVTGSRGGNAALADLLTELANLGLITDSTSA